MNDKESETERRRAEAAQWFARLKTLPVSHGTLNDFFAWRRQPGNGEAFEEAERFWSSAERVGESPEILRAIEAAERRKPARRHFGVAVRPVKWLAASIFFLLLVGGGYAVLAQRGQAFETVAGERRVVALDDGSRLDLNSGTAVRVRFTDNGRTLTLERGEALFSVAKDKMRPFTVKAGGALVTATGTKFDVSKHGEQIWVTLLEGSVTVRAPDGSIQRLRTGQQWRWPASSGSIRKVRTADVAAWTRGRIVFDASPLVDAIAEVNRHGGKPVVLDAVQFGTRRISGSFEAGDADSFVTAVTAFMPLRRTEDSQGRIHLTVDPTPTKEIPVTD
ncbi:FecR family protein [Sphingopyxis sp. MG]|uniref:FecR family protein n=1 Tax=Sphingopyxis sp. MG TaxID=1866325 RepID=UPI000CDF4104|nr:FecR domain-containing protein [Sphingopyxis sp. MG]AVA13605.1 hypothetical protein C3E99_06915 [Sphingopyxis sp. MG]